MFANVRLKDKPQEVTFSLSYLLRTHAIILVKENWKKFRKIHFSSVAKAMLGFSAR
jgi:hypothetical protein